MKFNLSVTASLLCLTLALVHPACAAGEATIDCSTTPDRCQVLPDLCNNLEVPDLGIIGDGTNVSVGSTFSASGGRPPYEVGVSDGVTLGYSDSGVTVSSIPACLESATLTMIDATEQTETKALNFFSQPLAISGPNIFTANAPYTVTGGCEPYTFTIGGGLTLTTSDNTATIADDPVCVEAATLTVRDFCQHTVEKEIQFPSQPLAVNGPSVYAVNAQYAASGGHGPYTWEASCGTIDASGLVTGTANCCNASVTARDACNMTASKEVSTSTGPLTISGPSSDVMVNSRFSATGGSPPYTWSVSRGTIDSSGKITGIGACTPGAMSVAAVFVTDACGMTSSLTFRYAAGRWVQTSYIINGNGTCYTFGGQCTNEVTGEHVVGINKYRTTYAATCQGCSSKNMPTCYTQYFSNMAPATLGGRNFPADIGKCLTHCDYGCLYWMARSQITFEWRCP